MKIGITGSTGVIGKILLKKIDKKHDIDCFKGDISKREEVYKWLKNKKPKVIFHLAAIVPVDQVKKDPFKAYLVNVGGTLNLLSCLKEKKIKPWIFYSSSSHVYKSSNKPLSENSKIEPINVYGETKYFAERVCDGFVESYGYKICIARIFSFYHDTQKPPFLYPNIMKRLKSEDLNKPFFLKGAKSIRDITNAEEIVDKILGLMKLRYSGVTNIGSGKKITVEKFVQALAPQKIKITYDPKEKTSTLLADTTKLTRILRKI